MDVKLKPFSRSFFNTLSGKEAVLDPDRFEFTEYRTILVNGEKAGVVGMIFPKGDRSWGAIQIALEPRFRGKGLLQACEDMLASELKVYNLYATIEKENIHSINSHKRAGFRMLSEVDLKKIRKQGFLKESQVRLYKRLDNG